MARWTVEPGHTAAEFRARHMMVTHVRGHFKDVHGTLAFDPKDAARSSVEVVIDARKIWTGEPARDAHLRSSDFLDVENFPEIIFRGDQAKKRPRQDRPTQGAALRNQTIDSTNQPDDIRPWQLIHRRLQRYCFDNR
jgi:polyisoprenoid-binding protein YceI